jgi:hypothetical protein
MPTDRYATATTQTRPPYEHETAAELWAEARNVLKEALEHLAAANGAVEQATKNEIEAWDALQSAAGRAPKPEPSPYKSGRG